MIDLATSLMTEFPDGVPPNSKGEQVLAELETTDEVVEHFVDRLSEIVHLRTKGDQKSMEKSKKVILAPPPSLRSFLSVVYHINITTNADPGDVVFKNL